MRIKVLVLMVLCGLCFGGAPAFAIDKIYSPNITAGEWELEYFGTRTFDTHANKNNNQAHEASIGYGVNDHWATEFYGLFDKQSDKSLKVTGAQWENHIQFFEPGEYWVDSGLLLSYTQAFHQVDASKLEAKLLLEKQQGKFLYRINTGIEQEIGPHSQGGPDLSFLWSSRYMYNAHVQPGFEIQSDFGKTTDHLTLQNQEHYVGPALYGHIVPHVKYEAAYLVGVTQASAQGAAKLLLEYELVF